MGKVREWFKGRQEVLRYLFFGVLTTAVNYLVYLPCYHLLNCSAAASNGIAWATAVIFAYLTNKPLVYKSRDWSAKTVIPELIRFAGVRAVSGLLETLIIFITVDLMSWNGTAMKLVTGILVVVLNYVSGRLMVFRKSS